MTNSVKIKLAVLFGGKSTEHDVSCISARSIMNHLDKDKYDIRIIGITRDGDWLPFDGDIDHMTDGTWAQIAAEKCGMSVRCRASHGSGCHDISHGVAVLQECDAVLPVLHGQNGEDGTVQGLFELLDIPYVGCGIFASAAGFDKVMAKDIFAQHGIPQAKCIVAQRDQITADAHFYDDTVARDLGFPCFVKPSNSGSSVGVYKVADVSKLGDALMKAQIYDRKILIEEALVGREIECAVLGNSDPIASMPGEIKPSKEFYDYEDKYLLGTSVCAIPADIPAESAALIRSLAVKAFTALDCSGLSRVDFFYNDDGRVWLNEINTLPGFTEISMYSKLWIAEGMTYSQLLDRLVELAFERRKANTRCYNG